MIKSSCFKKCIVSFLLVLASGSATFGQLAQVPPTLNGLGDPKAQLWNIGLSIIDNNATVTDPDSANFEGGVLMVKIINGTATDRLSMRNSTAPGQINYSGNNVFLGTTSIGTLLTPLPAVGATLVKINLKATATPASTTALLRSFAYRNQSTSEVLGNRTVQYRVLDGDGGVSLAANKLIRLGTLNGVYKGNYVGSVTLGSGSVSPIPGTIILPGKNDVVMTLNNGQVSVSLPGISGTGTGTISSTGLFSVVSSGAIGALGVSIQYSGNFVLSSANVASGSGTWTIVNSTGVTGSGTWSATR